MSSIQLKYFERQSILFFVNNNNGDSPICHLSLLKFQTWVYLGVLSHQLKKASDRGLARKKLGESQAKPSQPALLLGEHPKVYLDLSLSLYI